MYRCSEVVRAVSSDEFISAGFSRKLGIRLHLMMCRNCARYFRQLRAIGRALRDGGEAIPASEIDKAKKQILEHLPGKQ